MKKVNKILMSCVIAIITLNLIGCKDDEYWYDSVSPQWIAFYERDILSSEVINKYDMFYAIYKSPDTKVDCKILIGTTKGNMIELTDQDYKIEPFSQYMVTYNPYIIHNKDTVFGEEKTMKYYAIPDDCKLHIDVDYGYGEPAIKLHWNLLYNYNNETNYQCYNGHNSLVNVAICSDENVAYKKTITDIPINADSCYITQGGAFDNPDLPAYKIKYWGDGKSIMRYFSILYNIELTMTITVGDKDFVYTEIVKNILMDKQKFTCDEDLNIYRIAKIGDQIWTIDNVYPISEKLREEDEILLSNFYGECEYLCRLDYWKYYYESKYGFHTAWEEEWYELLSYYGIKLPEEGLLYDEFDKIYAHDTSMQKYFSTEGNWEALLSDFGWKYNEGYSKDMEKIGFNALPIGGQMIYGENSGIVCGENEFATFKIGSRLLIISSFYKGIAYYNNCLVGGAIRMVKKEEK